MIPKNTFNIFPVLNCNTVPSWHFLCVFYHKANTSLFCIVEADIEPWQCICEVHPVCMPIPLFIRILINLNCVLDWGVPHMSHRGRNIMCLFFHLLCSYRYWCTYVCSNTKFGDNSGQCLQDYILRFFLKKIAYLPADVFTISEVFLRPMKSNW